MERKVHVDISFNEETHFNTLRTLRLNAADIPHTGDTLTFSDVRGVFEVVDRILHYEQGELFSVRVVVKSSDRF